MLNKFHKECFKLRGLLWVCAAGLILLTLFFWTFMPAWINWIFLFAAILYLALSIWAGFCPDK